MLQGTHSFLRSTTGVYYSSSGVLAVVASAHTSLQGFWWLINPVGSAVKAIIRRLTFEHSSVAAAAANTRITVERITLTGGPASATIASLQRKSSDPAAVCLPLSATTGITPATVNANAAAY